MANKSMGDFKDIANSNINLYQTGSKTRLLPLKRDSSSEILSFKEHFIDKKHSNLPRNSDLKPIY